jgi:hypothetical protein
MATYCLSIIKQTPTDINYGTDSDIHLANNNLTRFDKDVFLLILEEMQSNSPGNMGIGVEFDNS